MPRTARVTVARVPLHVIQRGNNRVRVFMDPDDHASYRQAMFKAAELEGCAIHAFVLMSNHVHMLLTPGHAEAAGRMMRRLGASYVRRFNDRHTRSGTLWEGRFRSILIESDRYFFACSRYIELNPVRAGMVADPGAHVWSSFRHNAFGKTQPGITPHRLLQGLAPTARERADAYRAMFADVIDDATMHALRGRAIAGSDEFKRNVAALLERPVERYDHGGDRRSPRFLSSPRGQWLPSRPAVQPLLATPRP